MGSYCVVFLVLFLVFCFFCFTSVGDRNTKKLLRNIITINKCKKRDK